jgi:hypothetical protein
MRRRSFFPKKCEAGTVQLRDVVARSGSMGDIRMKELAAFVCAACVSVGGASSEGSQNKSAESPQNKSAESPQNKSAESSQNRSSEGSQSQSSASSQAKPTEIAAASKSPALTVYNQDFAVVREVVPLKLAAGTNTVDFTGMTAHAEPDSVILRDAAGQHTFQILEQNYRNDALTQERLLELYRGETIGFLQTSANGETRVVQGKIVRSGFVPAPTYDANGNYRYVPPTQPLIDVDGLLRFQLPGVPLFPGTKADTVLSPTMHWAIETDRADAFDAELAYVTGGMSWQADYNVVAPETGDALDLVGWVTIENKSGKQFRDARIQLIAGDVNKIQPEQRAARELGYMAAAAKASMAPPVSEKSFDEYHLYTLERPATLHDAETKQVEFVRAAEVRAQRIYVYEGAAQLPAWSGGFNADPGYGIESNNKVWVMREFSNSAANHLGIALPAGRVRFYRRDSDGRLQFTGENRIQHTPKDELLRVYTGNAFDLVGERKRTDFKTEGNRWFDESFEIRVRNHKKEPAEVRIVERLFRWTNWQIAASSLPFEKKDAQKIEFRATVPPDGEQVVTYKVHYAFYASDASGR